ncbi:MAG: 30S ribosomal protein S2 [Chitinophagales bacterium]
MEKITQKEMLDAGVHFGHLKRKWNPKMLQYIFMEKKGIHLIDLNKTSEKLEEAAAAMRQIAKSGRKILFVATKKQAKEVVRDLAASVNMPFVTERWLGGMLTNFATIRKSIKKMQSIDKMLDDKNVTSLTKRERLMLNRQKIKLNNVLGGIEQLNRVPAAVFVIDINHEHIAITESKKLGIRTFGMVDTNSNPNLIDFPIPANDDASKSITLITKYLTAAIKEGLDERQKEKGEKAAAKKDEPKAEEQPAK